MEPVDVDRVRCDADNCQSMQHIGAITEPLYFTQQKHSEIQGGTEGVLLVTTSSQGICCLQMTGL